MEKKEWRDANKSTEASLKAFDLFRQPTMIECKIFLSSSVRTTTQTIYDIGVFDRFENKDENFIDYNSFTKRSRGKLVSNTEECHYFLLILLKNFL